MDTYTIEDKVPTLINKVIMINMIRPNDIIDALANPTKSFFKHKGTVTKSVAIPMTKSRRTNTEFDANENNLTITLVNVSPTIML